MDKIIPFLSKKHTANLIRKKCNDEGIDFDTFEELIGEEFKQIGKLRKRGLTESFDDVLCRIYRADLE